MVSSEPDSKRLPSHDPKIVSSSYARFSSYPRSKSNETFASSSSPAWLADDCLTSNPLTATLSLTHIFPFPDECT
jgi:hypothetical protein